MNKKILVLLILFILLLSPFLLAYDLSDFPDFLIDNNKLMASIVVGEKPMVKDLYAAGDIYSSLRYSKTTEIPQECKSPDTLYRSYCPKGLEIKGIMTDKDISNEDSYILIGGPCANKITAQVMDLPTTWPECTIGFRKGIGKILLYNKWNRTQIIVAGYDSEDTRKAAEVLKNYDKFNLTDKEIEVVIGETGNLEVKSLEIPEKNFNYTHCIENPENGKYVQGQIIINFIQDVTKEQISELFDSYNLSLYDISYPRHDYRVDFSGDKEAFEKYLINNGFKRLIMGPYFLLTSNESITCKKATDIFYSFPNVNIENVICLFHTWGTVDIPKGEEWKWICELQKWKLVRSAHLNLILSVRI